MKRVGLAATVIARRRKLRIGSLLGGALGIAVPLAAVLLTLAPSAAPATTATPQITEFPTNVGYPYAITKGPDGNLWFEGLSGLGKVSPSGAVSAITGVANVASNSQNSIAAGPDGDIWFTTATGVGKINPTTFTWNEYRVDDPTCPAGPGNCSGDARGIVAGPDGRMWFTDDEYAGGAIGAITTGGQVSIYPTGFNFPYGIAAGADGNIWFATPGQLIGKVTTGGTVTNYTTHLSGTPEGMAAGPDGNLWIAEGSFVAKLTPSATPSITEYRVGPDGSSAAAITAGPDGKLWLTGGGNGGDQIESITTAGATTAYSFAAGISAGSGPQGIAVGPDGNIWFAEYSGGRIGRLDLQATAPTTTTTPTTTTSPKSKPDGTLLASVAGKGTITGAALNCPGKCKATFTAIVAIVGHDRVVTKLTLHASPAQGYRFVGWGGACPSAAAAKTSDVAKPQICTLGVRNLANIGLAERFDYEADNFVTGGLSSASGVIKVSAKFAKKP